MDHPDVLTVDDTLEDALHLFMETGRGSIWIVNDRERMRLVGMVTETDLMVKLLEAM